MKFVLALSLLLSSVAHAGDASDALKLVPSKELDGITILGCEKKPATYTVSCRAVGCTINVVAEKISCKGVRN